MLTVEDISEYALPTSVDASNVTIQGARKYEQIGSDAHSKLMLSLVSGAELPPRTALARPNMNVPSYVAMATNDVTRMEWLQQRILKLVGEAFAEGRLNIPGFSTKLDANSVEEPVTERPQLTVLLYKEADSKVKGLSVPDDVIKKWAGHPTLGAEFDSFMQEFQSDAKLHCGADDYETAPGAADADMKDPDGNGKTSTPLKSSLSGLGSVEKKRKLETFLIEESKLMDTQPLTDIPMCNIKVKGSGAVRFQIRAGSKCHVLNASDSEVKLSSGTFVAGFGPCKWQAQKDDDQTQSTPNKIVYNLSSSDELVHFEGKLMTLLTVINQKRAQQPGCRILYHDIVPCARGAPGAFTLSRTHNVEYVLTGKVEISDSPEEEDSAPINKKAPGSLQGSAASLLPLTAWTDLNIGGLVWTVKWSAQGLMPVRAQIVILTEVDLPSRHAVAL